MDDFFCIIHPKWSSVPYRIKNKHFFLCWPTVWLKAVGCVWKDIRHKNGFRSNWHKKLWSLMWMRVKQTSGAVETWWIGSVFSSTGQWVGDFLQRIKMESKPFLPKESQKNWVPVKEGAQVNFCSLIRERKGTKHTAQDFGLKADYSGKKEWNRPDLNRVMRFKVKKRQKEELDMWELKIWMSNIEIIEMIQMCSEVRDCRV